MTEKEILTAKEITTVKGESEVGAKAEAKSESKAEATAAARQARREYGPNTFADISYDAGFKAVFGDRANKKVLINLLNAILPPEKKIADLTYLDRETEFLHADSKGARLDLHCLSTSGQEFIVEMQKRSFDNFFERCVSYAGRTYASNLKSGWNYSSLIPVMLISFIEEPMKGAAFEDDRGALTLDYTFIEKETHRVADETIMLKFVLLHNLKKELGECTTPLEQYMYYFKNLWKLSEPTVQAQESEEFTRLFEAARVANFSKEKRQLYENNMATEMDRLAALKSAIDKATREGEAKGKAEGRTEGLAEGEAKGKFEGKLEGKLETAKALLAKGIPMEIVVECTGLTAEQVDSLI